MSLADSTAFFASIRSSVLGPRLSQEEVDGTSALLDACAGLPIAWTAYALATTLHETAGTMRPIRERGSPTYLRRLYDKDGERPHIAERLGNTSAGDGERFCGRGYVQLTGRRNYALAGRKLGVDLAGRPELAEDPQVAARVLREGMTEGWFSGKRFADFLPVNGLASPAQFKAARRIINGVDRDVLIAGQATRFQTALLAGRWHVR